MDAIITTPRLKLALVTTAERGSPEFNWIHDLRSNKQSSFWRFVFLFPIIHLQSPARSYMSVLTKSPVSMAPPNPKKRRTRR